MKPNIIEQLVRCGRCHKEIEKEAAEYCWYCIDWLCVGCWDMYGHCGHPEADEANEKARQIQQPPQVTA